MERRLFVAILCCLAGQIICCANEQNITLLNDSTGTLVTSSNYPDLYLNNEHNCWFITSINRVHLWIEDYDIEIAFDYLRIYEGRSNMDPLLASLTSTGNSRSYTSSGNMMFIEFTSDVSVPRKGFQACLCDSTVMDCANKCTFPWRRNRIEIEWHIYRNIIIVVVVGPAIFAMLAAFVFRIMHRNLSRRRQQQIGIRGQQFRTNHGLPNQQEMNDVDAFSETAGHGNLGLFGQDGTHPPGLPPYQPYPTNVMYYPPAVTTNAVQPSSNVPYDVPPPAYPGPPGPQSGNYAPAQTGTPGPHSGNYAPVHAGTPAPVPGIFPTGYHRPQADNNAPIPLDQTAHSNQLPEAPPYPTQAFNPPILPLMHPPSVPQYHDMGSAGNYPPPSSLIPPASQSHTI